VKQSGTYNVTLTAKNASGADNRPLRLVVGDAIALTPPIGWNSYDSFGDDVTEAEVLANARSMEESLKPYGWDYVIVDYRWYDPDASSAPNNTAARAGAKLTADAFGRLEPSPNRFPSAADGKGFGPLAATVHAMGLKFGVHIMRGIPRQAVTANMPIEGSAFHAADAANTKSICPWCPDMYGVDASTPAGQAWYDSLLRQYAAWGLDYIKVDDMSAPYSTAEIEAIHKPLRSAGVPSFSASPRAIPRWNRRTMSQSTRTSGGSPATSGTTGARSAISSTCWPAGRGTAVPAPGRTPI